MKVGGKHYRTIWLQENSRAIRIIDQRYLPHQFIVEDLLSVKDVVIAIKDMHVRGAGLIGATAAYGMYLAAIEAAETDDFHKKLFESASLIKNSRPTAVNLEWAVKTQLAEMENDLPAEENIQIARETAIRIANEDSEFCRQIGIHGLAIIEKISKLKKGKPVNILTHCNAGWLAFVDYGSATAPIYAAFEKGIDIHVWVDETRPRNQGAGLTAWELNNHGVPHTVIVDSAGGHLMQHGLVDMVITGADRVTRSGDAANKIGTYPKALAANDNNIPFYIALPSSSFDWELLDGVKEIPIEIRDAEEVKYIYGLCDNEIKRVLITPIESPALNYGFDVTPARLISGLITERGICPATQADICNLFPEKATILKDQVVHKVKPGL
jgi:methylthioribose-1-phosphate isomerase